MALKRLFIAILIIIIFTTVTNCVCLSFVGLNSLNYPRQWYNTSYDPSPNTTIRLRAMAIGDTPIHILDSDSDKINISIFYYYKPEYDDYRRGDNYTIAVYTDYNDWAQGVGADIFMYLPGNVNYTLNIRDLAGGDSSIYRNGSPLLVNYTKGTPTIWYNDITHPLPDQCSALYY